jgi:hypothetical protein
MPVVSIVIIGVLNYLMVLSNFFKKNAILVACG